MSQHVVSIVNVDAANVPADAETMQAAFFDADGNAIDINSGSHADQSIGAINGKLDAITTTTEDATTLKAGILTPAAVAGYDASMDHSRIPVVTADGSKFEFIVNPSATIAANQQGVAANAAAIKTLQGRVAVVTTPTGAAAYSGGAATAASGDAPTKAEFNALVTKYNALQTSYTALLGILKTAKVLS